MAVVDQKITRPPVRVYHGVIDTVSGAGNCNTMTVAVTAFASWNHADVFKATGLKIANLQCGVESLAPTAGDDVDVRIVQQSDGTDRVLVYLCAPQNDWRDCG